jgi:hypothetical protein
MNKLFDSVWYKWTVWWNPRGDLVKWIGPPNPADGPTDKLLFCKAIVRREDGLIFDNTLVCYECSKDDEQAFKGKLGKKEGHYFRGTGIFGERYNENGRISPYQFQ